MTLKTKLARMRLAPSLLIRTCCPDANSAQTGVVSARGCSGAALHRPAAAPRHNLAAPSTRSRRHFGTNGLHFSHFLCQHRWRCYPCWKNTFPKAILLCWVIHMVPYFSRLRRGYFYP
ncbi:hypothetical protein DAI22_01g431350 [Oryza sativa Japonica Group]|nr:hypothetical protein DAI22_01g431350 [Oryza sativa Japonica Group]